MPLIVGINPNEEPIARLAFSICEKIGLETVNLADGWHQPVDRLVAMFASNGDFKWRLICCHPKHFDRHAILIPAWARVTPFKIAIGVEHTHEMRRSGVVFEQRLTSALVVARREIQEQMRQRAILMRRMRRN